jgi:hypothetical protein
MREIAHSWKPEAVKGSVTKNMCQIGTQSQRLGVNRGRKVVSHFSGHLLMSYEFYKLFTGSKNTEKANTGRGYYVAQYRRRALSSSKFPSLERRL